MTFEETPKIQIPKFVADVIDKMIGDEVKYYDFDMLFAYADEKIEEDLVKWSNADSAIDKVVAYLNPLTRKFVEVVE